MWLIAVVLSSLLAVSAATSGMIINGERRLVCLLQKNSGTQCNLRQTVSERKTYTNEGNQKNMLKMNAAPIFLCKGPACIMNFIEKSKENRKRTGVTEDQNEITFYSGW